MQVAGYRRPGLAVSVRAFQGCLWCALIGEFNQLCFASSQLTWELAHSKEKAGSEGARGSPERGKF